MQEIIKIITNSGAEASFFMKNLMFFASATLGLAIRILNDVEVTFKGLVVEILTIIAVAFIIVPAAEEQFNLSLNASILLALFLMYFKDLLLKVVKNKVKGL